MGAANASLASQDVLNVVSLQMRTTPIGVGLTFGKMGLLCAARSIECMFF